MIYIYIYTFSRLVLVVLLSFSYFILSSKGKIFAQGIVSVGHPSWWGITRSTAEPEPISVSTVLAMASSDSDVPKSKQKAIPGKQGAPASWPVVMP